MQLAELYSSLEAIDGYRAKARAAAVMHGLGFQIHRPRAARWPSSQAAGACGSEWRGRCVRAPICCCSMSPPTTSTWMPSSGWKKWLTAFPGTLLMISHDREFLDAIIDRVLHIENRTIRGYAGNYSQFEVKRAEELALQSTLQARQVRRIAEITTFVNRFRASATKSRQAQSRLKMLERMERIVPAHVDSPFEFEFAHGLRNSPRPLLSTRARRPAAMGRRRWSPASTCRSARSIGLLCLGRTAQVNPLSPNCWRVKRCHWPVSGSLRRISPLGTSRNSNWKQLQTPPATAFWHVRNLGGPEFTTGDEQHVRDLLGRFGFEGDRAFDSGGKILRR